MTYNRRRHNLEQFNKRTIINNKDYTRTFLEFDSLYDINYAEVLYEISHRSPTSIYLICKLTLSSFVQQKTKTENLIYEMFRVECNICEEFIQRFSDLQHRYVYAKVEKKSYLELLKLLIQLPYSSFCILSFSENHPVCKTMNKILPTLDKGPNKNFDDLLLFLEGNVSVMYSICGNDGYSFCIIDSAYNANY